MRIDENSHRGPNGKLAPTPGQTIGPFFGYAKPYDNNGLPFWDGHHLVVPGRADAIRLHGTVYDGNGDVIPDAMIEIWQADAEGNVVQETGSLIRDGHTFTGWGRAYVDNVGHYSFTTVNPGPTDEGKAAFISVVVFARGLLNKLHTRVYLPEDTTALENDALLNSVDADRRQTMIAEREKDGGLKLDIHLQGENETVFLQFPGIEYPQHD